MEESDIKHILNSIDEFNERMESLEYDLELLKDDIWDIEHEMEPFRDGIKDVKDFIFHAKADNVLTHEMEDWIENYMRFNNG